MTKNDINWTLITIFVIVQTIGSCQNYQIHNEMWNQIATLREDQLYLFENQVKQGENINTILKAMNLVIETLIGTAFPKGAEEGGVIQ